MYEILAKKFNRELINFIIVNLQNHEENTHGINIVPTLYAYPLKYVNNKIKE